MVGDSTISNTIENVLILQGGGSLAAISVCKKSKNILNTIEGSIYKVLQDSHVQ
jgi:hypothetical protein